MYDHLVRGLSDLARSLKVSRVRRLTPKEIELIEESSRKFGATLRSLETSRQACQLLQAQLDRLKELMVRNLIAWQDEEDSVKEEHAELISELEEASVN